MISRRKFNQISALGLGGLMIPSISSKVIAGQMKEEKQTYENHMKGIRILPGHWRPHYPFEQIAWVSPPWPSQDYIWLDFPEAIFTSIGLIFLSHVNPPFPVVFPDLPKVPWVERPDGLAFDRELPNGIRFGGSLKKIKLQTCAYLRAIQEFGEYTYGNKLVHVPEKGWMKFAEARDSGIKSGQFKLGWRSGPAACDLPVMITLSNQDKRLVGMTWYDSTNTMVSNPERPCMHADPVFPDLEPGQRADIYGELLFFEGSPEDFTSVFKSRWKEIK